MRIVGGIFGGRRLVAPRGMNTRPTADRVREALFSALFDVDDLRVLDVYAGSGAVGLEALSRGARDVTFVESDRRALEAIDANIKALDVKAATVIRQDAARALGALGKRGATFDLIFADPPYDLAEMALPAILASPILAPGGRIVVEHRGSDAAPSAPAGLTCTRTKRYGEAALAFYTTDDTAHR